MLTADVDDRCWCVGGGWEGSGFSKLRDGPEAVEKEVSLDGTHKI